MAGGEVARERSDSEGRERDGPGLGGRRQLFNQGVGGSTDFLAGSKTLQGNLAAMRNERETQQDLEIDHRSSKMSDGKM